MYFLAFYATCVCCRCSKSQEAQIILFAPPFIHVAHFYIIYFLLPTHSAANSLAANGNTPLASTVPVTLSAVYFEDYLTGTVTDVTATYTANACATTAYLNGATPSAVCGFSTAQTVTELLTYPAFCQVPTFYTLL